VDITRAPHGAATGILKARSIGFLSVVAVHFKDKTLAVMEVSGGSQSFNTGEPDGILGRWDAHAHYPQPKARSLKPFWSSKTVA
jgi:hypothetical protein